LVLVECEVELAVDESAHQRADLVFGFGGTRI
jgi:hypothetical protein